MIQLLLHEDKQVPELVGLLESQIERETQTFAVHAQKMIEAAIMQLIGEDNERVLNSLLSALHAYQIVAGDAQKHREMTVVNDGTRQVPETRDGAMLLLGNETKNLSWDKTTAVIVTAVVLKLGWRDQMEKTIHLQ
ncbi:MAG: hypothetical protein EZS28_052613 [Streblomastix strix]|uniref:Uncharacterized protein n=1 Tax=Streblomastix strix TaxID=222440 RepID=A0A5J4S2I6_9EUKA|nr:MAG: hypothetical protein EZS28_052613 [Streblomastix strix]